MGLTVICASTSLQCPLPVVVTWLLTWNHNSYTTQDMRQLSVLPTCPPSDTQPPQGPKNLLPLGSPQKYENPVRVFSSKGPHLDALISPSAPACGEVSHSHHVHGTCRTKQKFRRGGKLLVSFITIHNVFPHKKLTKEFQPFISCQHTRGFSFQ